MFQQTKKSKLRMYFIISVAFPVGGEKCCIPYCSVLKNCLRHNNCISMLDQFYKMRPTKD